LTPRSPVIAIVDTNVVVSGLLTSEADAPTGRILDGMLERRFNFLLSRDLLIEYRSVLLRPKIQGLHGLREEEIDQILTEITANAIAIEPTETSLEPPDKKDRHLWQLLESHKDSVLVTGDRRLQKSSHYKGRLLSPREFVDSLEDSTS
jgi:putative PIN family toxin of toxin-antitoxin system